MILPDDVVERVARGIYESSHNLSNCYSWEDEWEPHQTHHRKRYYRDARAALEAARYGEMRQLLADSRSYLEAFRLKEAGKALMGEIDRMPVRQLCKHVDALLSTIGEPTDIGGV